MSDHEKFITTTYSFAELFLDKEIYKAMNQEQRRAVSKEIIGNLSSPMMIEANPKFLDDL